MNENDEFNRAKRLIEQSLVADDQQDAYSLWSEAVVSALVAQKQNQNDAECCYIVGYIFYKCPKKTDEIWEKSEAFLKRAIELSPSHQFARYYLACVLFDRKNYASALDCLNNISADFFLKIGQPWRILKADELRLCCNLYLSRNDGILNQADSFAKAYETFEDISLAPFPVEFANCLNRVVLERDSPDEEQLVRLCQICYGLFDLLSASDVIAKRWPLIERKSVKNLK